MVVAAAAVEEDLVVVVVHAPYLPTLLRGIRGVLFERQNFHGPRDGIVVSHDGLVDVWAILSRHGNR